MLVEISSNSCVLKLLLHLSTKSTSSYNVDNDDDDKGNEKPLLGWKKGSY